MELWRGLFEGQAHVAAFMHSLGVNHDVVLKLNRAQGARAPSLADTDLSQEFRIGLAKISGQVHFLLRVDPIESQHRAGSRPLARKVEWRLIELSPWGQVAPCRYKRHSLRWPGCAQPETTFYGLKKDYNLLLGAEPVFLTRGPPESPLA